MDFDVKQFRKDNHITQIELAKALDVSRQTILRWEKGDNTPHPSTFLKLQSFLKDGVSDASKIDKDKTGFWIGFFEQPCRQAENDQYKIIKYPVILFAMFQKNSLKGSLATYAYTLEDKAKYIHAKITGKRVEDNKYILEYNQSIAKNTNPLTGTATLKITNTAMNGAFCHFSSYDNQPLHGAISFTKISDKIPSSQTLKQTITPFIKETISNDFDFDKLESSFDADLDQISKLFF